MNRYSIYVSPTRADVLLSRANFHFQPRPTFDGRFDISMYMYWNLTCHVCMLGWRNPS